ncbi:STAS domain-containing protein [Streptomyces sp. NRRL S-340]|uniref:STAS domain-containing protein n=1 Tax=Streptomyces sp. NRRL S-340 TaxID=1463901 RepID=UPI0005664149|nr:STAS domain-containing protein [Streptomyces sp. NRRL S-340]
MSQGERHGEQAEPQLSGAAPASAGVVQYELNGAWVVVAHGDYDMNTITPLADALETAARKHSIVVLDVAGVTFGDSTFLNLLLRVHSQTSLRLVAPAPQFQRVLEITEADSVLDVRASLEDASMAENP